MRPSKNNIAFSVFVVVALVVILLGLDVLHLPLHASGITQASQPRPQAAVPVKGNAIVRENALPGTTDWKIPNGREASTQIQAYADARSVKPGQILTFYVSTLIEGISYSLSVYRLGWYQGLGGQLKVVQTNLNGQAQGYYDSGSHTLVSCNSCRVDMQTGLVEADWQPSYTLTIPPDWVTGIYLAKFTDENGMQTYVPFDVLGNYSSTYVAVTPDTTDAAYNAWGSFSLYEAHTTLGIGKLGRAIKVSFDRPNALSYGSAQVLYGEADSIHWLEHLGYDLSYMSDIDVHENPADLLLHRAYLSLGHDEYWTKEMRDAVVHARDNGEGLAFLGGNDIYWQIRLEPDSAGNPDRTIVCYKVLTPNHDLAQDPLYGKDNTRVTSQWHDPVLALPENGVTGVIHSGLTHTQRGFSWQVNPQAANLPILKNTGIHPGVSYGCGIVGNEWDSVIDNGATPAGLHILGVSPTTGENTNSDVSNTTYYIAPSGAMVFAAGSIYWTLALDSYRFEPGVGCIEHDPAVPGIQNLMARVMDALPVHHTSAF